MIEPRPPHPADIAPVVMADGWFVGDDGTVQFHDGDPQEHWQRFQEQVKGSHPDPGLRCPYQPCGWLSRSRDPSAVQEYYRHAADSHADG